MQTSNQYEQMCFDNAVLFTAIRGRQPKNRTRFEADTLEGAKAFGNGDHKTMIYAVTIEGYSAHICNA